MAAALRRLVPCAAALGCLWLVTCDLGRSWELAGQPGLLLKVQNYYETHAIEEGRCTAPIIRGVARSQLLSDDPRQMVVALDYYYTDWIRNGEDCSPMRPLRCTIMRECQGFAQRTFTIDKSEDGLSVASMSGPQRR